MKKEMSAEEWMKANYFDSEEGTWLKFDDYVSMEEYAEYCYKSKHQGNFVSADGIRKIFNKYCTLANKNYAEYIIRDQKGFLKAMQEYAEQYHKSSVKKELFKTKAMSELEKKQAELIKILDRYYVAQTRPSLDELIESEKLKAEIAELKEQEDEFAL